MKRLRLTDDQLIVVLGTSCAMLMSSATLNWASSIDYDAPILTFSERLQFVLRADLMVTLWLVAAIGNLARLRFFSQWDFGGAAGGGDSKHKVRANAVLQDTLEQVVLAVTAHLVLAATLNRIEMVVRGLIGLFVIGRLLFMLGYRHSATARFFGFALTFYPSALTLLVCGLAMVFG